MEEKKLVPKLRFPGFTEPWEQRKLGEITVRVKGNDGRMDLPTLTISAAEGWLDQHDRFSTNIAGNEQKNYTLLHRGELSYNHGNSKNAKYGVVFVLSDYTEALVPKVYHSFKVKNNNYNPYFIEYYFATKRPDKELCKLISSGARMDGLLNIGYEDFVNIAIKIPLLTEQSLIVECLNKVNTLLTLHQRKLEHLKLKKKSLLQKLFPKEGEVYPELRFPGFTDPWEQRKLGELANNVTEKNVTLSETETFTNSAELGIISQNSFFDRNITNKDNIDNYYIIQPEDFVYNPRISVTAPVGPINRNKLGRTGIISPLYTVFRPHDINTRYLEYFFKTSKWHSYMRFNGDSGARSDRFSIKLKLFYTMPIPVPSFEEQAEIGRLLERFTENITLHQRKLEHLQLLKKALLQQLFV